MRWCEHLVKTMVVVGFFVALVGCRTRVASEQSLPKLSQAELLRKPVLELFPQQQHFGQRVLRVDLSTTQRIQVSWGQGKAQRIYSLVRQGKAWWVLRLLGEDSMEAMPFEGKEIEPVLGAFYGLHPARCSAPTQSTDPKKEKKRKKSKRKKSKREAAKEEAEKEKQKAEMDRCVGFSGFDPERARMQVSFFGTSDRFLLRAMKTPKETGFAALHEGEWIVYRGGRLYEQARGRSVDRRISRIQDILQQLLRKKGWLSIPAEVGMTDLAMALVLGKEIEGQKQRLRPCFRKLQFPASVGPLSLSLRMYPTGKVRIRRHSSAHIKANAKLYWCLSWRLSRWKLKPFSLPYADLKMLVPPRGF